jgi:hypothetical protein
LPYTQNPAFGFGESIRCHSVPFDFCRKSTQKISLSLGLGHQQWRYSLAYKEYLLKPEKWDWVRKSKKINFEFTSTVKSII